MADMLNYFLLRLVGPKMGELKVIIYYFDYPRIERFWYDLEMKKREQDRNNKRTEIEWFDWFIERIQTRVAFGWLSERSGEKTSPENFLEIIWYFALTSYCNPIGQSNSAFSILGFSWAGKRRGHVLIFSPADKTNNEHLLQPFFKVIR